MSVVKIARHLETVHKNETKVKEFINLPKNNICRKRKIAELRRRGDYVNNSDAAQNNGDFNVCRRPNKGKTKEVNGYKPCPNCKGYFMTSNLRHHFSLCIPSSKSEKVRNTLGQNRGILAMARKIDGKFNRAASTAVQRYILPFLKEDDIGTLIRHDEFIILYANHLVQHFTSQDEQSMIRQKLRIMGRFLVTLRNMNSNVTDFASIYNPEFYRDFLQAAKDMAGYDENTGTFGAPTTATTIGTALKQIGLFLEASYIERQDEKKKKNTKDFVKLIKQGFQIINRRAAETLSEKNRNKKVTLPSTDDIQKLNSYLELKRNEAYIQLKKEFSYTAWLALAKCFLVTVQVFNRRRQGEISKCTIENFRSARGLDESTNKDLFRTLSEDCKRIAKTYVRFEVRGKRNRTVPVLITVEVSRCIDLLLEFRKVAGVGSKNTYLFGLPSVDPNRKRRLVACDLIRRFDENCGADIPTALRGTTLRKHAATMCVNLNLSGQEITDLANFLGHAEKIHKEIYRQPIMTREILGMSQLLETVQGKDTLQSDGSSESEPSNDLEIRNVPLPELSTYLQDDAEQDMQARNKSFLADSSNQDHESLGDTIQIISRDNEKRKLNDDSDHLSSEDEHIIRRRKKLELKKSKVSLKRKGCIVGYSESDHSEKSTRSEQKRVTKKVQVGSKSKGSACIKRHRWTEKENDIVLKAFANHIKMSTLPKLREAQDVIDAYPKIFSRRTAVQVKAHVNNYNKKIEQQ